MSSRRLAAVAVSRPPGADAAAPGGPARTRPARPAVFAPPDGPAAFTRPAPGLWSASLLVIAGLHAGAVALAVYWPASAHPPPPAAAMLIELAPLPAAPSAPPTEAPPAPVEEVASRPEEPLIEQPEPEPPPPPPEVKPEVVKPKPPPKPKPVQKKPPPEAPPADKPPVEQTTAPPSTTAPPAPTAAAPAPGASPMPPSTAVPTWQGALLAHLERHKRYPAAAQARRQQGVVMVRFTIGRDGLIRQARLERSSGHALLDREGLALLERAQPLPPPPPEMTGETVELVVPVQFFLK